MANAESGGHKAQYQGVAYFAPDGSNLGATIYLPQSRQVAILRLLNVFSFALVAWSFSDIQPLPWTLLPASLSLIALGMLIFDRKRLELHGDVLVGQGGVRIQWAEVNQFTSILRFTSILGRRRRSRASRTDIGAVLHNGTTINFATPDGEPYMVASVVDILNRFRAADEAGRLEVLRPFRVKKLSGSKRP